MVSLELSEHFEKLKDEIFNSNGNLFSNKHY